MNTFFVHTELKTELAFTPMFSSARRDAACFPGAGESNVPIIGMKLRGNLPLARCFTVQYIKETDIS